MYNKILLIGDTVSACKVALSAMVPVIGAKGHSVYTLPTEIVSNTFGYKKVAQISTGDYVEKTIAAWEELGFSFDAVFVGYVTDKNQAQAIFDYCKKLKEKGAVIFHDPIMGEKCHLYWGIGEEVAEIHKQLLPLTDYTFPSWTEAAYLAGRDFSDDHTTKEEIFKSMNPEAERRIKYRYLLEAIIKEEKINIKVLPTNEKWYGITYKEDKKKLVDSINKMINEGKYPKNLWN